MLVPLTSAAPAANLMTLKLGGFVLMVATEAPLVYIQLPNKPNPWKGTHQHTYVQRINYLQNEISKSNSPNKKCKNSEGKAVWGENLNA